MSENKKDIEEEHNADDINFYLDFIIEGMISSSEEDIDKIKKSLNKVINKFLTQEKLNNINVRVTKYSDIDIAMSSLLRDDEFH